MPLPRSARLRIQLRTLIHRRRAERDLAEELQFHLDREAEHSGRLDDWPIELVKEQVRDAWGWRWVAYIAQDLRYATRLLGAHRGFAATAMLTVALGVGATTAIFSIVYGVILRPLPYADPARLVTLWMKDTRTGAGHGSVGVADHRDWVAQNRVFDEIALVRSVANFDLTGAGEPERLFGARISANLLPALGVTPLIGRGFREEENTIGNEFAVLLSYDFWQRRFNGDPRIVGTPIRLNSTPYSGRRRDEAGLQLSEPRVRSVGAAHRQSLRLRASRRAPVVGGRHGSSLA